MSFGLCFRRAVAPSRLQWLFRQRQFPRHSIGRGRNCRILFGVTGIGAAGMGKKMSSVDEKSSIKFSVHIQEDASFLKSLVYVIVDLLNALKMIFRTIQLAVICAPLFISAPVVILLNGEEMKKRWFSLLVRTLEQCGPVWVKFGQWAATRRDLFPENLCDQLSQLQKCARVHAWKSSEKILKEKFGTDFQNLFVEFDEIPVGSGCCAQVYKAKLRLNETETQNVAVKILHPDIEAKFSRDLQVMFGFTKLVEVLFPSVANWLSFRDSLEQFSGLMKSQIDLQVEAKNMTKFSQNFASDLKKVVFPKPFLELSSKEVLVETFEEGIHVGDFIHLASSEDKKKVAAIGVDVLLNMVI